MSSGVAAYKFPTRGLCSVDRIDSGLVLLTDRRWRPERRGSDQTMTNNLMDAQTSLLRLALHRTDCRIVVPIGKGGPAKNLAVRMMDADWFKASRMMPDAPRSRKDESRGSEYFLKLTTVGFRAVSASQSLELDADPTSAPNSQKSDDHSDSSTKNLDLRSVGTDPPEFRVGSKIVAASMLLGGEGGITIKQLFDERNWLSLSYSTLTMLAGLRQLRVSIPCRKRQDIRTSAYAARNRCRLQSDRSFYVC